MTTPICISYARFSTEKQSHGNSLERQLKSSREYASEHGYVIDEIYNYQDLGLSAYTGEHAKFGDLYKFLTVIKSGGIPKGSILLVESLDRLSRENVLDAFTQLQEILNADIKVVTLCDKAEYTKENLNNDFSKLLVSLSIMMRANEESKTKSMRVREGFAKKRDNLANVKMTANVPSWLKLNKTTNTFEILEDRADLVRRMFQMSYDGIGIITIERQFNKEKIPAFRSKIGWYSSTIRKILSSCSVIGEYQPCIYRTGIRKPAPDGETFRNYFPAIVDSDLYYAVQARLSNGSHIAGRTAKVENLFGGITNCGYCGARMDVVNHNKATNDLRYLTCTNARRAIGCSYVAFKCIDLEHAFLEFCKDKEILDVLNLEGNRDKDNKKGLLHQLSAKNGELQNINNKISILDDEIFSTNDKLERAHFKGRLSEFLHTKNDIERAIAELSSEISKIDLSFQDVDTRVKNILEIVEHINKSSSEEERISFRIKLRNNLRQIIEKVVVYPRGNITTDEQIENLKQDFETKLNASDSAERELLIYERDTAVNQMLQLKESTKNDKYFEVFFKNGNFRRIHYIKADGTFKVSINKVGSMIEWSSAGKTMKPIYLHDENKQIKADIELYKKNHPELNLTPEDIEVMEESLTLYYSEEHENPVDSDSTPDLRTIASDDQIATDA